MISLYWAGALTAKVFYRIFARLEVYGEEHLPPNGPLIIVANHLSDADPPALVATIRRKLRFIGKQSLFANPMSSMFFRGMGVHPIDRDRVDIGAIRWVLNKLNEGHPVVLFPEGARSGTGRMRRAQAGAAYLATKSQALILPVAITGTEEIKRSWRIVFPFCRINVNIGQPFNLPTVDGRLTSELLENLSELIMGRISGLLPETYRGYYSVEQVKGRR